MFILRIFCRTTCSSSTFVPTNKLYIILYIKPAVEGDGGAIEFDSFSDGIVKVILKGACSGCPSSTATLKHGIESLLKQKLGEEIKEVVSING